MQSTNQGADGATAGTHASMRGGWQPWLSTLCGAGCGLALWVALSSALLRIGPGGAVRTLLELQAWGLGIGAALALAGLGVLLPRPADAGPWWNRTLAALVAVVVGCAVLALMQLGVQPDPTWLAMLAAVTCFAALAAIAGLALLETGQAGMSLPTRLAQSLLCGASLLFALFALRWPAATPADGPAPSLALLVLVTAGLLLATWHGQGGLRAWTARRSLVLGLCLAAPLLLAALAWLQPGWARTIWPLVALSVLLGTAIERQPR